MSPTEQLENGRAAETSCEYRFQPPKEVASQDPDVLRAALMRESVERRRAECSASMQTHVVKLALDLRAGARHECFRRPAKKWGGERKSPGPGLLTSRISSELWLGT